MFIIICLSGSWLQQFPHPESTLGFSCGWTCQKIPAQGDSEGSSWPDVKPPQLALLNVEDQQLYSEPLMSEPLTLFLRLNPATLQRNLILSVPTHNIDHEWIWSTDWAVNPERLSFRLSTQQNGTLEHHRHCWWHCSSPPVNLLLHIPFTHEQDAEILEFLHSRSSSFRTRKRAIYLFGWGAWPQT